MVEDDAANLEAVLEPEEEELDNEVQMQPDEDENKEGT